MKAIVCKYIGPSNFKGSRIKAYAEGGKSLTISYPHELSGSDVYRVAAEALCKKMNWPGELIEGGLPNGDYVFVFAPKSASIARNACKSVMDWAKTPGNHGGVNPYMLDFVKTAEAALEA